MVPIDEKMRENYLRWFGNVQMRDINTLVRKKWVYSSWENELKKKKKYNERQKITLIELIKKSTC